MISMTLSQYFICFVIYSFLGWLYESLFYSVQYKKLVNTGFLHICICPIYGFACVGNVMLLSGVRSGTAIFLGSMIMISAMEYIISLVMETLFEKRWWDYSDWPLNLNGRISLLSSLAFGAMSLIQMRIIHPVVASAVYMMSQNTEKAIIGLFIIVVAMDIMITVKGIDKSSDRLWFVNDEPPAIHRATDKVSETFDGIRDRIREKIGK